MRTPIVLLVVAVVVGVAAATGAADIAIVSVVPSAARAGAVVRVHVSGYLPHAASMPVVLVRADLMPRPYACRDRTAICEPIVWRRRLRSAPYHVVGRAAAWTRSRSERDRADSFVRVRVPKIAAGRYRFALWCAACVRGPQGSLIAGPLLDVRAARRRQRRWR